MTRISSCDTESNRAMVAREEFIAGYCFWWPAIYKAQIPVTYDGESLLKAKEAIEAMMDADFAAVDAQKKSPWNPVSAESKTRCIDWSKVNGIGLYDLSLGMQRPLGMPAFPKQWSDDNPEVNTVWKDSHRTAEFVAHIAEQRAMRAWHAASYEYVVAANSGADEATVSRFKAHEQAAAEVHAVATTECELLRSNPAKGLRIVRESLSEDEQIAEQESIKAK